MVLISTTPTGTESVFARGKGSEVSRITDKASRLTRGRLSDHTSRYIVLQSTHLHCGESPTTRQRPGQKWIKDGSLSAESVRLRYFTQKLSKRHILLVAIYFSAAILGQGIDLPDMALQVRWAIMEEYKSRGVTYCLYIHSTAVDRYTHTHIYVQCACVCLCINWLMD